MYKALYNIILMLTWKLLLPVNSTDAKASSQLLYYFIIHAYSKSSRGWSVVSIYGCYVELKFTSVSRAFRPLSQNLELKRESIITFIMSKFHWLPKNKTPLKCCPISIMRFIKVVILLVNVEVRLLILCMLGIWIHNLLHPFSFLTTKNCFMSFDTS